MTFRSGRSRPGPLLAAAGFLVMALTAPVLLVAAGQLLSRHLSVAAPVGALPGAAVGAETAETAVTADTADTAGTVTRQGGNLLLATPVRPRPVADPPFAAFQEFLSGCRRSTRDVRKIDGTPLLGDYFGSVPGRSGTSCDRSADRSTYWVPALRNNGRLVSPEVLETYYRSGVDDYTSVQAFPDGLVILSAYLDDRAGAGVRVSWECSHQPSPALPTSCPRGSRLHLRLQTPSCWDGRRLDSSDHKSHMTFPAFGRCPDTHPVAVPQLDLNIFYPPSGGPTNFELGSSARFWYRSAWKPGVLAELISGCVNAGIRCPAEGARRE